MKTRLLVAAFASSWASVYGATYSVADANAFRDALNKSVPGDTINLKAGVTFSGSFGLPKKSGSGWITIQSSAISSLPAGVRVKPADAIHMAKVIAPRDIPAIYAQPGAHHYRIQGLEIATTPGVYNYDVVQLGSGNEKTADLLPYYIELDRVYIHGDPKVGGKRGVFLNSTYTTVKNSYICDFKSTFQDTQAVGGFNGPGPFDIINNYLEAAGENVMFGGAVPNLPNVVPSNIRILRNHFYKPLSWRGSNLVVKNLLEFKNARNVTVEGNIFENNWRHSQSGAGVLITPNTESGRAPWAVTQNILFTNNIFRRMASVFNIGSQDGTFINLTKQITIRNNVIESVDKTWGGSGDFMLISHGPTYLTIDHNTILQERAIIWFGYRPGSNFVFQNNIVNALGLGISGDSTGPGIQTLNKYVPGYLVRQNALIGASSSSYPSANYFPASISAVLFKDLFASDYTLLAQSPYLGRATDGKALGADLTYVRSATAGVVTVTRP